MSPGAIPDRYIFVHAPHAEQYPWVCSKVGCNEGLPRTGSRQPCPACGAPMIVAGRHGRLKRVERPMPGSPEAKRRQERAAWHDSPPAFQENRH